MTPEEIKEVLAGATNPDGSKSNWLVYRLIEERDALLDFARDVAETCDCDNHHDDARAVVRLVESGHDSRASGGEPIGKAEGQ